MDKFYNVTVQVLREYQVQVDAIDEVEAGTKGCNAVEDGEGELVETLQTNVVSVTELVSE